MAKPNTLILAPIFVLYSAANVVLGQAPSPLGELIDIGGRRLHLHCTGNGSPAVIVENGDGAFSIDWALVQPEVSKRTKICTYDRAGYAWSDRGPIMDMVGEVTGDLHLLLQTANITPPYVLVGASMGGAYVRAYQRRYPDQIAALVLVDATHDEGVEYSIEGRGKPISLVSADELRSFMNRLLERNPPPPQAPAKISAPADRLPQSLHAVRLWSAAQFFSNIDIRQAPYAGEANREEFVALRKQRVEHVHPLGNLPLIVLARTRNTDDRRKEMQAQLAALSAKGRLVMAQDSGHEIHLYRPDLVIEAISDIVEASRRNLTRK
jgi:pimeloyl-ACP methyl ester carboxylesterase